MAFSGASILVVDDELVVREFANQALSGLGYRVLLAEDGGEGLELFRVEHVSIDLVIVDAMMPVISGPELFRELRLLDPDVKVILSSGYNEVESTRGLLSKGLCGFIQKPYLLSVLAQKVRSVLDR